MGDPLTQHRRSPIPIIRNGYPSHAFDAKRLEIYLYPERFHYVNRGWCCDCKTSDERVWLLTIPKGIVERINQTFPGGVKVYAGHRYATLRFFNETDFVLFGMKYVLGEEQP